MSDVTGEVGLNFTEREMQMLAWAMQSLKSGPPEIDYEKLASYAGMSNPRSASNAWAKIKAKLASSTDTAGLTPKKGGGRKKATNTDAAKETPRKRAAKKQDIEGEGTPKKKGRQAKSKKIVDEDTGSDEAEEPGSVKDESGDDKKVKADVADEDDEMAEEV
ncbi:hypothetical protein CC80DRAFT_524021 [Byssothecium circinans]|uniref:Uncharacterized protein n=1 Tax=Byssothecium circinans TaxID=147558 RepID=A0A6A5U387_9PLEO|nr:hypothetical protein CC80DRAFT_524021 [Byssothecium circinans]